MIDKPLLQYAIDEVRAAGVERLIFVTHPSKSAIARYVMDDAPLRAQLVRQGKSGLADLLHRDALDLHDADVIFVNQHKPLGLGDAVWMARDYVLDGPVAVILPDDLILGGQGCLREMSDAYADCDCGHLIAAMPVPRAQTSRYGILSITRQEGRIVHARDVVEKPQPENAPSQLAVVGRYILDPVIFDALGRQAPGAEGEIQLSDAITISSPEIGVAGFRFSGQRFDCGSKHGLLAATLYRARTDPVYAALFKEYATPPKVAPVS